MGDGKNEAWLFFLYEQPSFISLDDFNLPLFSSLSDFSLALLSGLSLSSFYCQVKKVHCQPYDRTLSSIDIKSSLNKGLASIEIRA